MIDSIIIKINNSNYNSILELPKFERYKVIDINEYSNLDDNYIYINESRNITKLCKIPTINTNNLNNTIDCILICVINKYNKYNNYYVPILLKLLGFNSHKQLNTMKPTTHKLLELTTSTTIIKYLKLIDIDVNYLSIVYFFPRFDKECNITPIIFNII